mgnify:FL=1
MTFIPDGIEITFSGQRFSYATPKITIEGKLIVTSADTVAFLNVIQILVQEYGIFSDETGLNKLYFLAGSTFTLRDDAEFNGDSTYAYSFTLSGDEIVPGGSKQIGSHEYAEYTLGVTLGGLVQKFFTITQLVLQSGIFTDDSIWAGGLAPTEDYCHGIGGCVIYISPDVVLSMENFKGDITWDILQIIVDADSTLKLGSSDSTDLIFAYYLQFDIYGTLQFLPDNGGTIYLPFRSVFNFYPPAKFISSVSDPTPILAYKETLSNNDFFTNIAASYQGPYYAGVDKDGIYTRFDHRK